MKETRIWIVADRQYRGYERLRVKIMKISELLQRIDYMVLQGNLSDEVTGICHDNRMIQEGDAFICISGARFDTHTMAKELAKKAALLVVEKPVELEDGCKTAVVQVASTRDIVAALAAAIAFFIMQPFMDIHLKRWFVSELQDQRARQHALI